MKETPSQYIRRIESYLGKQRPFAVLQSTPGKLERLLRGLTPAQARHCPAPGKWSVAEICGHMIDAEVLGAFRFRQMLTRNGIAIQAMNQDGWAALGRYQGVAPSVSLAAFRSLREWNLRLWRSLSARQRKQFGRHEQRGKETVEKLIRFYAGHDLNHLQQLQAVRRELRSRRPRRKRRAGA